MWFLTREGPTVIYRGCKFKLGHGISEFRTSNIDSFTELFKPLRKTKNRQEKINSTQKTKQKRQAPNRINLPIVEVVLQFFMKLASVVPQSKEISRKVQTVELNNIQGS